MCLRALRQRNEFEVPRCFPAGKHCLKFCPRSHWSAGQMHFAQWKTNVTIKEISRSMLHTCGWSLVVCEPEVVTGYRTSFSPWTVSVLPFSFSPSTWLCQLLWMAFTSVLNQTSNLVKVDACYLSIKSIFPNQICLLEMPPKKCVWGALEAIRTVFPCLRELQTEGAVVQYSPSDTGNRLCGYSRINLPRFWGGILQPSAEKRCFHGLQASDLQYNSSQQETVLSELQMPERKRRNVLLLQNTDSCLSPLSTDSSCHIECYYFFFLWEGTVTG